MSSQPARTQRTAASPRRSGYAQPAPPPPRSGGLQVTTLIAAAVAAVVAATVVSRFWQAGTIMATAMTPVLVAVVKEMVERPARRVSSIATRAAAPPVARSARRVAEPPPEAYAPPPPVGPSPELTAMRVYGRERAATGPALEARGRHGPTGLRHRGGRDDPARAGRRALGGVEQPPHHDLRRAPQHAVDDDQGQVDLDRAEVDLHRAELHVDRAAAADHDTTAPGQTPTTAAPQSQTPTQTAPPTQTQPPPAQTQPPAAQQQPAPTTP